MKVRSALFAFVAGLALQLQSATAQQTPPAQSGFSFAVYGDSRSMMYLPYKADQEAEARDLMVDMFELVLPEKVAALLDAQDVGHPGGERDAHRRCQRPGAGAPGGRFSGVDHWPVLGVDRGFAA